MPGTDDPKARRSTSMMEIMAALLALLVLVVSIARAHHRIRILERKVAEDFDLINRLMNRD